MADDLLRSRCVEMIYDIYNVYICKYALQIEFGYLAYQNTSMNHALSVLNTVIAKL